MKNQESGRSMIEMLGVLAIMGIITVAAVMAITYGMTSVKRSNVTEEVMHIVSGVRDQHRGFDDFSDLDNTRIWGAIGMASARSSVGGNYSVATDNANPRQFVVSMTGLNKSDCEYFATRAWSDSVGFRMSDGKSGGATGDCRNDNGQNTVSIVYGE